MSWVCEKCKAHNLDDHNVCQMCGTPRPNVAAAADASGDASTWSAQSILGGVSTEPDEKVGWRGDIERERVERAYLEPPPEPDLALPDSATYAGAGPEPAPKRAGRTGSIWSEPRRAFLAGFSLLIVMAGLFHGLQSQYLIVRGRPVFGTISRVQTYSCGPHSWQCDDYVVLYRDNYGRLYQTTTYADEHFYNLELGTFRRGSRVQVYYDPNDPQVSTTVYTGSTLQHWMYVPLGLVMFLLSAYGPVPKRKLPL